MAAMQAQIQALLTEAVEGRAVGGGATGATEMAKLQTFDGTALKVSRFLSVYKLYIKMWLRELSVEKQIQWILSYVYGGSADI